jgi:hypothetical protein
MDTGMVAILLGGVKKSAAGAQDSQVFQCVLQGESFRGCDPSGCRPREQTGQNGVKALDEGTSGTLDPL